MSLCHKLIEIKKQLQNLIWKRLKSQQILQVLLTWSIFQKWWIKYRKNSCDELVRGLTHQSKKKKNPKRLVFLTWCWVIKRKCLKSLILTWLSIQLETQKYQTQYELKKVKKKWLKTKLLIFMMVKEPFTHGKTL